MSQNQPFRSHYGAVANQPPHMIKPSPPGNPAHLTIPNGSPRPPMIKPRFSPPNATMPPQQLMQHRPVHPPVQPRMPQGGPPGNPIMMMMQIMKNNPKVDPDWIEYCMPRMMQTMSQMMEEFKQNKQRVRVVSLSN